MANLVEKTTIVTGLKSDFATFSGGAYVATLPVEYMQSRVTAYVARTQGLNPDTQAFFNVLFSTPQTCNALVLGGVNFTAGAQIQIEAAADLTSLDSTPTMVVPYRSAWPSTGKPVDAEWTQFNCVIFFPDTTFAAWRVKINDPTNPALYLDINRTFLDKAYVPHYNVFWSLDMGQDSYDLALMTPYGGSVSEERGQARTWALPFDFMKYADAMTLDYMWSRLGTARDFFCIVGPCAEDVAHRFMMTCRFADMPRRQPVSRAANQLFKTRLDVVEVVQ